MRTEHIFDSHDDILVFWDKILRQCYFTVEKDAQQQVLRIDLPKGLLQTQFAGLELVFPSDNPHLAGKITMLEMGNPNAKTPDEKADNSNPTV